MRGSDEALEETSQPIPLGMRSTSSTWRVVRQRERRSRGVLVRTFSERVRHADGKDFPRHRSPLMTDAMTHCKARVAERPWCLHHNVCVRLASSTAGLCKQHQRMYERDGFIAVTTGYDGPVTYLRPELEPTHD